MCRGTAGRPAGVGAGAGGGLTGGLVGGGSGGGLVLPSGGGGSGVVLSSRVGIGFISSHRAGAEVLTKLSKLSVPAAPPPRPTPVYPPVVIPVSVRVRAQAGASPHEPSALRYWPVSVRNTCARSWLPLATSDTCSHCPLTHVFDFTA